MTSLYQRSINILLENQSPTGAFPASPNFPPYQYCWFRDGSFISHALDIAGHPEKSDDFHRWCARTILRYQQKILDCISIINEKKDLTTAQFFHCRFTVEGDEVPGHWGNHQLDGLGTWMWSYNQHLKQYRNYSLTPEMCRALDLIAGYLYEMWKFPCSDCWEENETQIHTSTLASVYAGLLSHSNIRKNIKSKQVALEIKEFLLNNIKPNGYFNKSLDNPEVDASLLGIAIPYELVDLDSPIFQKTLSRIERDLISDEGGLHRYLEDTYYGGGEWILLSAWYGWIKLKIGDVSAAKKQLIWIEKQADSLGNLPEQVNHHLFYPAAYPEWIQKWNSSASPLLWSHAMYIILKKSLERN